MRPFYEGTGTILLQPSLAGYHIFEVAEGERWILEPGVYWASEASVRLGIDRDPIFASFWAGDGFFSWKTDDQRARGRWRSTRRARSRRSTSGMREFRAQGRLVLGRTDGLEVHVADRGAVSAQLHLGPEADAGVQRHGQGAGGVDALLEPPHVHAHDRRGHRAVDLRVTLRRGPFRPASALMCSTSAVSSSALSSRARST